MSSPSSQLLDNPADVTKGDVVRILSAPVPKLDGMWMVVVMVEEKTVTGVVHIDDERPTTCTLERWRVEPVLGTKYPRARVI